jgi:hypothetical protein
MFGSVNWPIAVGDDEAATAPTPGAPDDAVDLAVVLAVDFAVDLAVDLAVLGFGPVLGDLLLPG